MGAMCSCSKTSVEKPVEEIIFRSPVPCTRLRSDDAASSVYESARCPTLQQICLQRVADEGRRGTCDSLARLIVQLPHPLRGEIFQELVRSANLRDDLMPAFEHAKISSMVSDQWMLHLPRASLKHLEVPGCFNITDLGLRYICECLALTHLNLRQCLTISSWGLCNLTELTELRSLNLSCCRQLDVHGLMAIANLTKLTSLNLEQCVMVDDEALLCLQRLTKLRELNLAHCFKLTDKGLSVLKGMRNLRVLNISRTRATNAIVCELRNARMLRVFQANGTLLEDSAGKDLQQLRYLETVHVDNCHLGDCFLSCMKELPNLRDLSMAYTRVTDAGVASFVTAATGVRHLNLDSCGAIGDFAVEHMVHLTNLRSLNVSDTALSSSGLSGIAKCSNLRTLVLTYTNISNAGLQHLGELHKLERLGLDTKNVSDQGLKKLRHLTALRHLDLFGARISDAGLSHIAELVNLESLEVCGGGVTDVGLDALLALRHLKNLNLSQNHRITNAGVSKLRALPALKSLNLAHTRINDGISDSISNLTSLRTLGVQGCLLSRAARVHLYANKQIYVVGAGMDQCMGLG